MSNFRSLAPLLAIKTDIDTLSQYLDFQPGEDIFFDDLVSDYGEYLQNLTQREKLYMLAFLANSLSLEASGDIGNRIIQLSQKCLSNLGDIDLLGLMSALSDQVRAGHYAESNIKTGEA